MPIFEYQCTSCDYKFSELRKGAEKDDEIGCPKCEGKETKRLVTGFAVNTKSMSSMPPSCPSASSCPSAGFG